MKYDIYLTYLLYLLLFPIFTQAQIAVNYTYQTGTTNYKQGSFPMDVRIPASQRMSLPSAFFSEVRPPKQINYGFGACMHQQLALILDKDKNTKNKFVIGHTERFAGSGYNLDYQYLKVGKTLDYTEIFYETEAYALVGKQKALHFFGESTPRLSVDVGVDVGLGLSFGKMAGLRMSKSIVTNIVRDSVSNNVILIKGYGESSVAFSRPYCTFILQIPLAIRYNIGNHFQLSATATQNYFAMRPLYRVRARTLYNGNIYFAPYSQSLFGFGAAYRFDSFKLPKRKK